MPHSAARHRVVRCGLFAKAAKTIVEVSLSVAVFGRPLRGLSSTVPVSLNLAMRDATVLCEIGGLSGCRLLKSAAMIRQLRCPDI